MAVTLGNGDNTIVVSAPLCNPVSGGYCSLVASQTLPCSLVRMRTPNSRSKARRKCGSRPREARSVSSFRGRASKDWGTDLQRNRETLPLKRNGRHLTALCPLHCESTPSFWIYADHYHCFGCSAHGDVIDWLMATREMTFKAAVVHLTGVGHDWPRWPPPAQKRERSATAGHVSEVLGRRD